MEIQNSKLKVRSCSRKVKSFWFFAVVLALGFLVLASTRSAQADVPVREQNLPLPVWVQKFDSCTEYEKSLEKTLVGLFAKKQQAERSTQMQDIIKAREDVNKLVATVYNELRTQQIAFSDNTVPPDVRDVLHSVGIAVSDNNTDEICKASYYIKAQVGTEGEQCVAVVQEARFITNQDDYIYEEGRRRAMDMLFCYIGEWRHFPIGDINDPSNCEQLGLEQFCSVDEIWEALGQQVFQDADAYNDIDGTLTPVEINDDQHVHNLCEGMRALGKKCAQDMLRDYIKYSTIDKITRKDRTIILAPPQTWYTPDRCKIIEATLPSIASEAPLNQGTDTPFTKNIKSLNLFDPNVSNSSEFLDYYFASRFGNPTISKPPSNMGPAEYTIVKELQAINVPENGFSGLAAKAETLANQIIAEFTDLRKQQYTAGEGLRDATLRIGWKDYEWEGTGTPYLGKYPALDLPVDNPKIPNKIFKPLPCYWEEKLDPTTGGKGAIRCEELALKENVRPKAAPTGKTFYFDTGIVISPISITKSKLQSAIQAQFDLAAKAFDDKQNQGFKGSCGASANGSTGEFLPAPWEDIKVNLSTAINPLTGEPYTYGTPGKANPPFRIPGINNNYFNFLYNDVFQLYHTSFPDVLAGWFRLNTPAYDSIYGPLKEPIQFSANGDPGSGPPGGGGIGGGSGRGGSGSGKCEPITTPGNPCSVENLQNTCFGANAQKASAICNVESAGGNPLIASGSDLCKPDNVSASYGLFQINLSANDMPNTVGGANNALNCAPPPHPAAFDQAYTGSNHQCKIENQGLFEQCRAAAFTPELNIQKACELSKNGTDWHLWGANKICGF